MEIYWALLVCLVGLVLFFVTNNPTTPPPSTVNVKINTLSLYCFWVGLFVFLLQVGPHSASMLGK